MEIQFTIPAAQCHLNLMRLHVVCLQLWNFVHERVNMSNYFGIMSALVHYNVAVNINFVYFDKHKENWVWKQNAASLLMLESYCYYQQTHETKWKSRKLLRWETWGCGMWVCNEKKYWDLFLFWLRLPSSLPESIVFYLPLLLPSCWEITRAIASDPEVIKIHWKLKKRKSLRLLPPNPTMFSSLFKAQIAVIT